MIEFIQKLKEINIELSETQKKQFELYYDFLIKENEKYNLTAITDKKEVYFKHFYDSLMISSIIDFNNKTFLDVGSGAGFPSIPLKICFPSLNVVIIDSLLKRTKFLEELKTMIGLTNVTIIHGRAEEYELKNEFDFVSARAVARLNILTELCLPFVKKGGYFLAYKGKDYQKELDESKNAIKVLNGKYIKTFQYNILDRTNYVLLIEKKENSKSAYPRQFSKIKKNPL